MPIQRWMPPSICNPENLYLPFDNLDLEVGKTNGALPLSDTLRVKARLTSRESELRTLYDLSQSENSPLKKEQLRQASNIVDAQITKYKIALAPWKLLPLELLQIIFNYTLHSPHVTLPPRISGTPVLICLVCKAWQTLALSTPELWSSVYVSLTRCRDPNISRRRKQVERSLKIIKNWFTLAKGGPLHLDLVQGPDEWKTAYIERMVVPYLPRLKTLRLSVTPNTFDLFFKVPAGTMDSIVNLSVAADVVIFPSRTTKGTRGTLNPFGLSPQLTHLTLRLQPSNIIDPQYVAFPWTNLKILHIDNNMYLETFMEIAGMCGQLEELHTKIVCRGGPGVVKQVNLPNLHTMSLSIVRVLSLHPLDFPVNAPKLRMLCLTGNVEGLFNTKAAYQALLRCFGCNLEEFSYKEIRHFSVLSGETIIEATPSLRKLSMPPKYTLSRDFLQRINDGEVGQSLEELEFIDLPDVEPILDFLERQVSMQKSTSNVRQVVIYCEDSWRLRYTSRIEALRKAGIEIISL
ncbi:hypothetical protein CPC08DRAFT_707704 [Agrocybe pediades]|nr:hypothetical protein CPC08DRAFT_707704 [Agrocybe pediades]